MVNISKEKGKRYERDLAAKLTDVFQLNFMRVPNSGSFTGGKNVLRVKELTREQNTLVTGDIIPPQQLSEYNWECKFYKDPGKISVYLQGYSVINEFIKQAQSIGKKYWFVCFKTNYCGEMIIYDKRLLPDAIVKRNYLSYNEHYILTTLYWTKEEGFFHLNKDYLLEMNMN